MLIFVGLFPQCVSRVSCLCAFVGSNFHLKGISLDSNFSSWVFRGSEIFSRGYFMGPTFFLVGISSVQDVFLVGISWV